MKLCGVRDDQGDLCARVKGHDLPHRDSNGLWEWGGQTQERPPEPSLVDKVIEFAEKLEGVELQPWQERMMRAIFSGHGVVPTINVRRRY